MGASAPFFNLFLGRALRGYLTVMLEPVPKIVLGLCADFCMFVHVAGSYPLKGGNPKTKNTPMKTYIFADFTPKMNHYEVVAFSPAEAVRMLANAHGVQAYRIVNILP